MTTVCASRNTFKYKKQRLTYLAWKYLNEELEFMECLSNSLFLLINCELKKTKQNKTKRNYQQKRTGSAVTQISPPI